MTKEEKNNKKENWKIKKQEIKEQKQNIKNIRKEEYKDAPILVRLWSVYKSYVLLGIATLALIAGALVYYFSSDCFYNKQYEKMWADFETKKAMRAEKEDIYSLCPIDEEGAKRIDALEKYNKNDTWTFCVYMVGSNLEDDNENDLSDLTKLMVKEEANEIADQSKAERRDTLYRYKHELAKNGLDYPKYMYNINKPTASSTVVTNNVIVAEGQGAASSDIGEMLSGDWGDNVNIVVQTGGATRWSNAIINPNMTQRFLIKNGNMKEIDSLPLQNPCSVDTLSDFIKYCDSNYKSDHMAIIFWDHGAGVYGYGYDSIFGGDFSLAELREALQKSCPKNETNPYFDIIGFDACLMATLDTAHYLNGYGKYLVASEEVEPGEGWDYGVWLQALSDNPTMNAAEVSRAIADAYIDFYVNRNINVSEYYGIQAVTFSVINICDGEKVYKAYDELNKDILNYALNDMTTLTDISRAASRTVRYAGASYDVYNLIDLKMYLDYLSESYPEECEEVRNLVNNAVLYHRENVHLSDSTGMSIYFPVDVKSSSSIYNFLQYDYDICEQDNTKALYYYKMSGCLNDELQSYVKDTFGVDGIKKLNVSDFVEYERIEPTINDDNQIIIPIKEELSSMIVQKYAEIIMLDKENDYMLYYGTDDVCDFDKDGSLTADFDGRWFSLGGVLLDAKLIASTENVSTYESKVYHNGVPSKLTFTYDILSEKIDITSIVALPEDDDIYVDVIGKNTISLNPGDEIVPIMKAQTISGNVIYETEGDKIKYKEGISIELVDLPEGDYLGTLVITDLRGDTYYSPVVQINIKNGVVTEAKINREFIGKD